MPEIHMLLSGGIPFLIACYILFKLLRFGHREKHLPPGPSTVPILGNAHLLPSTGLYIKFKEWSDQYGHVFSLKVGSSTIVVLNDPRAVHELLNQKGALFSDRPVDEQWELLTNNEAFAVMHSGHKWRASRKIASQVLSPKHLDGKLAEVLEAEITQFTLGLLDKPEDFRLSVQRTSASIASIVLYGHRAPIWDSFWASTVHETVMRTVQSITPGSYLPIAQFPVLGLIPDRWVPSKQFAKDSYRLNTEVFAKARTVVEERRRSGDMRESLIDRILDGTIKSDVLLTNTQVNNTLLGTLHQAGSDTSAVGTLTSILFLAKHPQVQEKARVELDRVCGTKRLPQWTDAKDLPYINCIVKEGLRIRPVTPNGIPYRAKEDVWYDGMLIPKDATIFLPVYALNHTHYPDPETYNPDRYLDHPKSSSEYAGSSDYRDRDHYAFGAGRRFCVGISLAERTLWRMIAQILWAFKIEKTADDELDIDAYEDGIASTPEPFMVRLVPRSTQHADVIRRASSEAAELLKRWE